MMEFNKSVVDAAQQNNVTAVKLLMENNKDSLGMNNLVLAKSVAEIAVAKDNLIMLKYIVKKNSSLLKDADFKNSTLLRLAITSGSLDMVKYLIDHCKAEALASHCLTSGDTYVHLAAELGRLNILKYFIEAKKVSVNLRNELGQPLLFTAARGGRLKIVEYLVEERRADITTVDNLGRNLFSYSAQKGDLKVPNYLLDKKKLKIAVNNTLIIHDAIIQSCKVRSSKRTSFIKYFVEEKGIDINGRDKSGRTPLHLAAREGTLNTVMYLVHHGGDIKLKSSKGRTPLHFAAGEGKLSIVEYFVQLGADIHLKDFDGETPLHLAASEGRLGVVDYLVRRGANVHSQDSKGKTPLQLATNENVIKYLERNVKKRTRRSMFESFIPFQPHSTAYKWLRKMMTEGPSSSIDGQPGRLFGISAHNQLASILTIANSRANLTYHQHL